jgi:hypothetical protein
MLLMMVGRLAMMVRVRIEWASFLMSDFGISQGDTVPKGSRMVVKVLAPNGRHQGFVGSIMKILGLFPNTIMTSILKATLDAPLTGTFIALIRSV